MYELPQRPPMDASRLSLILTVPSAATEAAAALQGWVSYLNGSGLDYELLLAGEQPGQPIEELAAPYARVRPLPASERGGFGIALRAGLSQAQHPLLCYARCDLCYRPADVKQLLKVIDKVDLALGQRVFSPGSPGRDWRDRLYGWFVRGLFGVRLPDLSCLFVLARRAACARIVIQSQGLFAHTEVLAKANFLGCYFSDVAVAYRPPAAAPAADEGRWWADARRVLAQPDFGPVRLPEPLA